MTKDNITITIKGADDETRTILASAIEGWLSNGAGFNCLADFHGAGYIVTTKAARKRYPLGKVGIYTESLDVNQT